MPTITVNVAVLRENQVLLVQRDDFEVWSLPGGGVEADETLAQAAIRETKEETGLDVELTRLIGLYSRLGVLPDDHAILFAARVTGGTITTQPGETIDVHFFSYNELPENITPWYRKRIRDARDATGSCTVVTQKMSLPDGRKISQKDIVKARKFPRETRIEFFQQVIQQATFSEDIDILPSPLVERPPRHLRPGQV